MSGYSDDDDKEEEDGEAKDEAEERMMARSRCLATRGANRHHEVQAIGRGT